MPGAHLPNLAALRLGEGNDDEVEEDTGEPSAVAENGHMYIDSARQGPKLHSSTKWPRAILGLRRDGSVSPSHYVELMQNLTNFAFSELEAWPKYLFIVDGENLARDSYPNGYKWTRLARLFDNIVQAERRDLYLHRNLHSWAEWRQPTALFMFTSKSWRYDPGSQHDGATAYDWYASSFSQMMQRVVTKFIETLEKVDENIDARPQAVALQMHISIKECKGKGDAPCQEILKAKNDKGHVWSVCYNYGKDDAKVHESEYKHAYCEFDDLAGLRLYQAAFQIFQGWKNRTLDTLKTWGEDSRRPDVAIPGRRIVNPYDKYKSGSWEEAQRVLQGVRMTRVMPTPFIFTGDGGMAYQQLNDRMVHVNWEWALFAPRFPENWVREQYLQEQAYLAVQSLETEFNRLTNAMEDPNAEPPTPLAVDGSIRRVFAEENLLVTVYPTLLDYHPKPWDVKPVIHNRRGRQGPWPDAMPFSYYTTMPVARASVDPQPARGLQEAARKLAIDEYVAYMQQNQMW